MNKNNRKILAILVLLLIAIAALFIFKRKEYSTEIPVGYQLQDSTIIGPGKMEFKIWDHSIVDSDIVNIKFNGKPIFHNLLITHIPVVYKTGYLKPGRYWIGVEGISCGGVGTASPHLSLTNGKQNFEFNIEADTGQRVYRLLIVK